MATGGTGPARRASESDREDDVTFGDVGSDTDVAPDPAAGAGAGARPRPPPPLPPHRPIPQTREELDAYMHNYMEHHRQEMTMLMAATTARNNERLMQDMTRSIADGLRIGAMDMTPPQPAAPPFNPLQHRKIPPPIFKGTPGERPDAHILRAEDWFDAYQVRNRDKHREFKHTLDHLAREWYDSAVIPEDWDDCKRVFSKYFSTQGRSIKHLHDRWRHFSFNPDNDDIEKFVRDVKECARQLNYDDQAILHLIKSCMPTEVYGVLYSMEDLNTVVTLIKDIYARKVTEAPDSSTAASSSATAPFTAIYQQLGNMKAKGSPESQVLDKLSETLYKFEIKDKPKKPFKPFITPPRRRGRGRNFRGRDSDRYQDRDQRSYGRPPRRNFNRRGRGGRFQNRSRNDGRKFDKSPNIKRPRVASRTPDRDKDRCHRCWKFGHWKKDCRASRDEIPDSARNPTYDDYCRYDDTIHRNVHVHQDSYAEALAAMNGALDLDSPLRGSQ